MDRSKEPREDLLLMTAVATGDKPAFRQLYEQTYGQVSRYVRKLVGDETLAEDIVIQTYTAVWQSASRYEGTSRVTTWMIGIARNVAFKEFRKLKHETPFDEAYCAPDEESRKAPELADRRRQLQKGIAALSAKHREVLELVFYQGLTYPEVSKLVDTPVNTVKTRIFHAKKALKDVLETMGIQKHDI